MYRILSTLLFITLGVWACSDKNAEKNHSGALKKKYSQISYPKNNSTFKLGDAIPFKFDSKKDDIKIDSVTLSVDNQILFQTTADSVTWNSEDFQVGSHTFVATIYLSNEVKERKIVNLKLLAPKTPEEYSYQVVASYPHDTEAYTQGLLVDNGILYESTGQKSESTLRTTDLRSGNVTRKIDIPSDYFGEGIATVGDSIYMLTWEARKGFVFDKNTFEQLGEFRYPTEGWGLTSMPGDTLVMSDGSNKLFFKSPTDFSDLKAIEVYTDKAPIDFLNELEYINGKIFANRYQTDLIYIIDPHSGIVEGILNLTGILDKSTVKQRIDVLNGIAYNELTKTYYITGKWWPTLFEIQIIDRQQNPI